MSRANFAQIHFMIVKKKKLSLKINGNSLLNAACKIGENLLIADLNESKLIAC